MTADIGRAGEVTEDGLLGGLVRLRQPARGHRAGTDAVLLAGLAPVRAGDAVIDLGSASGAVGLMIAARHPDMRVLLVEREPDLAALARENVALNGHDERVRVVQADAFLSEGWAPAGLLPGEADLVVTNPPFFAGEGRASPDPGRRRAHVMEGGDLAGWIAAASRMLRPNGRLALIHRADALPACLSALGRGFGSVSVVAVHARPDADASRIVIVTRKGGRAPLRIAPPLVLHGDDRAFTEAAASLHGRGAGGSSPSLTSTRAGFRGAS